MSPLTPQQYFREGRLDEALHQLQAEIKKNPAEVSNRVFLFQLLAVLGQWERALAQLGVCGELDAANLGLVQVYRELIRCELLRERVFSGQISPLIFGEPEPWMAFWMEAIKFDARAEHEKAEQLRNQALETMPQCVGSIDGAGFEWIGDTDSRLGAFLEAVINGRYFWIPFFRIASISMNAPSDLRDMIWVPARFTWTNQGDAYGYIPARYPDSCKSADAAIRMSRKTCWDQPIPGCYLGQGQRVLATDVQDYSLLDIRQIVLAVEGVSVNG